MNDTAIGVIAIALPRGQEKSTMKSPHASPTASQRDAAARVTCLTVDHGEIATRIARNEQNLAAWQRSLQGDRASLHSGVRQVGEYLSIPVSQLRRRMVARNAMVDDDNHGYDWPNDPAFSGHADADVDASATRFAGNEDPSQRGGATDGDDSILDGALETMSDELANLVAARERGSDFGFARGLLNLKDQVEGIIASIARGGR